VGSNTTRGKDVCLFFCVLSGLCDELITRPEDYYRLWCFLVCDLENLMNEMALAHWRLSRQKQANKKTCHSSYQLIREVQYRHKILSVVHKPRKFIHVTAQKD
jgi:hypothetical protein